MCETQVHLSDMGDTRIRLLPIVRTVHEMLKNCTFDKVYKMILALENEFLNSVELLMCLESWLIM